jgi:hypothetical protein
MTGFRLTVDRQSEIPAAATASAMAPPVACCSVLFRNAISSITDMNNETPAKTRPP